MNFCRKPSAVLALLLAGCGSADKDTPVSDNAALAREIARTSIIVDGHVDVPDRIALEWDDVTRTTEGGDYDYPRAVAGGLNAPFMSIYTAGELEAEGQSKAAAEHLIDLVEKIVATAPEKHAIARSPADIETHFANGIISLPLGMENGSPIHGDLANLKHFYDRGIRYVTLAHGLSNHISDSSYDTNRQWGGLSEFGVEVVREMNRLGIMVDVSHISDDAVLDVLEVTAAPVIASHSSARHFTPGWERNMSDELIVRLAENGGIVMINFGSMFISKAAWEYSTARREAYKQYREANGLEASDELEKSFVSTYAAEHGDYPYATLDQVLDHFDHVVKLTSVDNVGIGSDYDGVGDSLPTGLKDVSTYPNLIEGLLDRDYSVEEIRRILGGNLLRVWREVEAVAERS